MQWNWRKPLIRLGYLALRKSRYLFENYDRLCDYEYRPMSKNLLLSRERLTSLLLHAYQHVPYYRSVLTESGAIDVHDNVVLENFSRIPALTKDILREQFDRLRDTSRHSRAVYGNTSGGSTGEPVRFLQDNVFFSELMAFKYFGFHMMGKEPGDREIRLWGSERDLLVGQETRQTRLKYFLYNSTPLNAFRMTEAGMRDYIHTINRKKPKIIEAYVQSIYELAVFAHREKMRVYSPPSGILVSAGTLYPDMRTTIEGVFRCRVFNRYGSREVGDMACECDRQEGLHVNALCHYIEILDDDMNPVGPGEIGRVYVTLLSNYTMPLIRYDIGDIAERCVEGAEQCSCGRGLPLIKSIRGRDVNIFTTREGTKVDGEFFTHLFYFKDWCRKFQVVQTEFDRIVVKLVLDERFRGEFERDWKGIIRDMQKVMGDDCMIEYEKVEDIAPTPSGKYVYTVSLVGTGVV